MIFVPAVRVKWNNACFYQISLWFLPKGLPLFFVYLSKLEEGKTHGAHLALDLQRNELLANNLFLLWELLRIPIPLGCVSSVLFCFVCFMCVAQQA